MDIKTLLKRYCVIASWLLLGIVLTVLIVAVLGSVIALFVASS